MVITFSPSESLAMFEKTASDFGLARLRAQAREAEAARAVPSALADEYVALGLHAVELSEAAGGLAQGMVGRVVVDRSLAYGDLALCLALPWIGPGAHLMAQDDPRLADWAAQGKRVGMAWSEVKPKPGTFMTRVRETEDGLRIDGKKTEVLFDDATAALVVFAHAGEAGPGAFLVEATHARVDAVLEGLGLDAAQTVSLTFEDAPAERLDVDGPSVVDALLSISLVGAARATGLAKAAFEYARDYAEERTAFGKPISHFQGLAFLLADMATRVSVMDGLLLRAAWALDHEDARWRSLAAGAAAECHEGAMWVANNAVQVLGGAGFVNDHPVEKWMRDAKAHMAYAMPHTHLDLLLSRLALEDGPLALSKDAPMPGLGAVLL